MEIILAHAHTLMYTLLGLMPSRYQRDNLSAMLGLFLAADGKPLPHYSLAKSESASRRFLNTRTWPTRKFIYHVRKQALEQINSHCPLGRKAFLQVIIDLTTLEKCGKFKGLENLISVYNGKRGLHIVVLYLVIGLWRIPWNFRVWKGKGTASPAQMALRMVRNLPKKLTQKFQVKILADTAFGTVIFYQRYS